MPWSCFVCNGRGGASCPGHAVAPAGSEQHCCPAADNHKWFCARLDCRGHSAPGPFIAGPGPMTGFSEHQQCPSEPGAMWYCRARGCQGHTREGQTCRDSDCRDDATQHSDADGPKFFCRWTGCNGHSDPSHSHTPADVRAAEAARGAPTTHAAAINRTTALAPPTRLQVAFKYFDYVYLDNFRAVTSHDEYVSDERLWDSTRDSGEPRTTWLESLVYSILRTGPGPRRGYRGENVKPVTTADQFRTLWGSRLTSASGAGMPSGHGPDHVSTWPQSSPLSKHFVHIWAVNASSTDRVPTDRVRVVEVRSESDWTETNAAGGASRGAGGQFYTLLPDARYYIIALPYRLSEDAITDIAVLIEYSMSASGDDANMFSMFELRTSPTALAGVHGARRENVDLWFVPVVNPFHIALRMANLAANRFEYLAVTEPQRGASGLSDAQAKRRYGAIYSELVGHLAQGSSDFAETLSSDNVGNDCKRFSLYHRRAAGGIIIALAYLLNSRPVLELEYLTQIRQEDMDAGGGWWVMTLGECMSVLARHTAGIEVLRLRQDGASTGDFISPISRWLREYIEPETASLPGPGLPADQPTGGDTIFGYVGNAADIGNSLYEAWSYVEVLRRGLDPAATSSSSMNSRLNDAASKLRDSLRDDGYWSSRASLNATRLTRFVSLGTAAYKLYKGEMDYSAYSSALGTVADIWAQRAGEQSIAAARCMFLKTALAAAEVVRSGHASYSASVTGDTSVAVGSGMIAAASGLTVAWTIAAGTAPAGPVGWCIGAVALTGGLVVALTTDDDIEIYGRYCRYSSDRRTDWPTSLVGEAPLTYLRADTDRWGEDTAEGYKANLVGLLCYIYKVHGVELLPVDSDHTSDRVKIELHASPAGASVKVKVYYRSSGATGAMSAAVGSGSFKIIEVTITRLAGQTAHVHTDSAQLTVDRCTCSVSADSSKWELQLSVRLDSSADRDNWTLYDAYVRVNPFGTDEFRTPATGWWASGGHTNSLP